MPLRWLRKVKAVFKRQSDAAHRPDDIRASCRPPPEMVVQRLSDNSLPSSSKNVKGPEISVPLLHSLSADYNPAHSPTHRRSPPSRRSKPTKNESDGYSVGSLIGLPTEPCQDQETPIGAHRSRPHSGTVTHPSGAASSSAPDPENQGSSLHIFSQAHGFTVQHLETVMNHVSFHNVESAKTLFDCKSPT